MSLIKVKEYLKKYGYDDRIMEFTLPTGTVEEASHELKCTPGEIAKSLSFLINYEPVIIVVKGDNKVDNHKFKETFKVKAKMIDRGSVEELTGHAPGGVCPFGLNDNVKVYLDVSLKQYNYVYPACGSGNSAIKLSLEELEKLSNFVDWVDVTKEPEM